MVESCPTSLKWKWYTCRTLCFVAQLCMGFYSRLSQFSQGVLRRPMTCGWHADAVVFSTLTAFAPQHVAGLMLVVSEPSEVALALKQSFRGGTAVIVVLRLAAVWSKPPPHPLSGSQWGHAYASASLSGLCPRVLLHSFLNFFKIMNSCLNSCAMWLELV